MKHINIIPGKHICNRLFDMRITKVDGDKPETTAWIVYGICKKCEVVMILNLFVQHEEPKPNADFIIDYTIKSEKGTETL